MVGGGSTLTRIESAVVAALAVVLSLGAWWVTSLRTDDVESAPILPVLEAAAEGRVTVHVAGSVHRPGVVVLEPGSRVVDAVEAAGGATVDAVLSDVNLAEVVADGSRILIPSRSSPERPPVDDGTVAVNRATAAELETLPGVGPVLAMRIIETRDRIGRFETAEDLLDVPGIGEATLARLRPHLRLP